MAAEGTIEVGDRVKVPDGREGIVTRMENDLSGFWCAVVYTGAGDVYVREVLLEKVESEDGNGEWECIVCETFPCCC